MKWLERFNDLLRTKENHLTDNETLPHESPKSKQSVNVPDTIDEMSHEEREAVFRDEIVAPFVEDRNRILDEEETNLIEAMKVLYLVPDIDAPAAEWPSQIIQSNKGRNKSELDAELYEIINKRLNERGHIWLSGKDYQKFKDWKRYRGKNGEGSIQEIPEISLPDGTEDDSAHRTKEPEYEDSYGNQVDLKLRQLEPTLVIEDDEQLADDRSPPVLDSPGKVELPEPERPEPERIQIDELALRGRVEELLNPTRERIEEITRKIDPKNGQSERLHLAFGTNIFYQKSRIAVVKELDTDAEIWFAGDVHADLLGFEAIVQAFESKAGQNANSFFLVT